MGSTGGTINSSPSLFARIQPETYVEHTMIDAMTLTRMQTAICEAISSYDPSTMNKQGEDTAIVKAYPLASTPAIDTSKVEYADVILPHFGKDFLLKRSLPIKGVFELLA
ncbi:hypothetical protein BDZ45DRAFT_740418 [Acephala macrosclerotiorum]|nr:hypothetical protein BDZ45DRAFT_740418 [Acephala macrosclerotiorum]